jgi:hypothetical protein
VLGDGSLELAATLPAGATSYSETVGNYTSYTYAVQAINAAGSFGDIVFSAPFQVGTTFADRRDYLLDHLSTDVPNLGQFGGGPHRIGRTGFWHGEARMLRGDTATGLNYIATALEDASAENSNAGFSMWPGMDAWMRWNGSFSQTLKNRYQEVYTTSDLYDNSATPNQRFMICTASYLANGVWGPAVNSVSSATYATGDPTGRTYLENTINAVPWKGYPEHHSTQYLIYTLAPMLSLAEFSPDPVFKNKARMAFDWGMAEAVSALQNGRWVTPVTRGGIQSAPNGYSNTSYAWWLLHGGPTPSSMLDSSNIAALASATFPGVLPEINTAATDRTQSYLRRNFATRSVNGDDVAYFKQTWMTPRYALTSQVEGTVTFNADGSIALANVDTDYIQDGYQGQRWGLAWDSPPGNDSVLEITSPTTYSGSTGGISIWEDTLQHEDTMIAVYNMPVGGGGSTGNNGAWANQWLTGHIPAGYQAITDEAATTGRIFIHYDSVLVAVYLNRTFSWGTNFTVTGVNKAALAIETAAVDRVPSSNGSAAARGISHSSAGNRARHEQHHRCRTAFHLYEPPRSRTRSHLRPRRENRRRHRGLPELADARRPVDVSGPERPPPPLRPQPRGHLELLRLDGIHQQPPDPRFRRRRPGHHRHARRHRPRRPRRGFRNARQPAPLHRLESLERQRHPPPRRQDRALHAHRIRSRVLRLHHPRPWRPPARHLALRFRIHRHPRRQRPQPRRHADPRRQRHRDLGKRQLRRPRVQQHTEPPPHRSHSERREALAHRHPLEPRDEQRQLDLRHLVQARQP